MQVIRARRGDFKYNNNNNNNRLHIPQTIYTSTVNPRRTKHLQYYTEIILCALSHTHCRINCLKNAQRYEIQ